MFDLPNAYGFRNAQPLESQSPYRCWNCDVVVAATAGLSFENQYGSQMGFVGICPICKAPTFVFVLNGDLHQRPVALPSVEITGLPEDIGILFEEARRCLASDAPTACTMICRKLLMNIAVHFDAPAKDTSFQQYVEYLSTKGYVSPAAKGFADKVRLVGNDANHQITPQSKRTAELMVRFVANILRNNFEAPGLLKAEELGP